MDVYGERSRAGPQQPTLNSSYPSQRPNGELPSQLKMVSSRQPDTLPFPRKRSAHRTKTQSRRLDTIIRHALRQSLQSGLLKLQTQSAGMEPLVQSFNGKITKQSGWYEELGYIPRDDLECKSQILYWQDGASSCTLTVHITAEPTVDGMNAQSQRQEGDVSDRKSVWLEGTATFDENTEDWSAKSEMEVYTPDDIRNLIPRWRSG